MLFGTSCESISRYLLLLSLSIINSKCVSLAFSVSLSNKVLISLIPLAPTSNIKLNNSPVSTVFLNSWLVDLYIKAGLPFSNLIAGILASNNLISLFALCLDEISTEFWSKAKSLLLSVVSCASINSSKS